MSDGPAAGTIMIQPVKNGWVVLHWPEHPDEPPPGYDPYDPSVAFGNASRPSMSIPEQILVAHAQLRDEPPEPDRYVFEQTHHVEMIAFCAKLTRAQFGG